METASAIISVVVFTQPGILQPTIRTQSKRSTKEEALIIYIDVCQPSTAESNTMNSIFL